MTSQNYGPKFYFVYVLFSLKDRKLYVGFTESLRIRVNRHYQGKVRATKNRRPVILVYFEAFTDKKDARSRAVELIDGIPEGSRILLLGAVTEIVNECTKRGLEVSVLDLDHSKIGLIFDQKRVEDSRRLFAEKIKQADYVIATGMIFVSETADSIFEAVKQNGCKLILYLETGSNFGKELLKYGAYKVLSEVFPYYDFFGDTKYIIFEKSSK